MPLDKAVNYIKQVSEIEGFNTISITGGEPFLYYKDLLEIIKTANSYKFNVTCGTNGFWAKTEEIAGQKLDELISAGLNYLSISVDAFHSKYVPIENIRNILRAARERDISVRLTCIITKGSLNSKDIM
jgi:MoaA/NifB/PqqE/SkfB family radical SAM enzyme